MRGLDYYRHTAFEFVTDRLGAQGTVLGGGRYDGLIETLGGAHTPAVGWAAGIERLAMLVGEPQQDAVAVVLAVEDDGLLNVGITACSALRRAGYSTEMISTGSPRKRFDKAAKIPAKVLVGISIRDGHVFFNQRSSTDIPEHAEVEAILASLGR